MAHRFTVIFEKEAEGYHVFCPTLPGCHTQSETIEEASRIFVEPSGCISKAWSKTVYPSPRKTS